MLLEKREERREKREERREKREQRREKREDMHAWSFHVVTLWEGGGNVLTCSLQACANFTACRNVTAFHWEFLLCIRMAIQQCFQASPSLASCLVDHKSRSKDHIKIKEKNGRARLTLSGLDPLCLLTASLTRWS